MPATTLPTGRTAEAFGGFEHLDANYIYCPNQFFEVCVRHYSRGVVRLVAYILRETLGHLDKNGNPVRQDIRVSYSDICQRAGVSTRAIPKALDAAQSAGFIQCVTPGVANSRGQRGRAAEYRLRWCDEDDNYTDDPQHFRGFFVGDGHRSPIPNGYFDIVVRSETLAMAKVVGVILRHTVGYQNQFGGRRSDAPLAYSYIQRFANIGDRTTLSETLKRAAERGYICCVAKGNFDPNAGRHSCAARYAVKWLEKATGNAVTAKTRPSTSIRGKNPTGNMAETLSAKDGKNPTDRKTSSKTTYKQHRVAEKHSESYALLVGEGIDPDTAARLATLANREDIQRQVAWLDFRNPRNRPAMLRRAIEEQWSQPDGVVDHTKQEREREREEREIADRGAREAAIADQKRAMRKRRSQLLVCWRGQSKDDQRKYQQQALRQAASNLERRFIRQSDIDNPAPDVLEVMALATGDPMVCSS